MRIPFWKIFTAIGILTQWIEESMRPDSDGGVKVTTNECVELVRRVIQAMGWNVVIGE